VRQGATDEQQVGAILIRYLHGSYFSYWLYAAHGATTGVAWSSPAYWGRTSTEEGFVIKVSVLYPYRADARFDHDYYQNSHLPLVQHYMGASLLRYSIEKGLGSGVPGEPPIYIAACHLYCDSVESFQAGMLPHSDIVNGDIKNYTDLVPVIQISEVVVD
jgi:uncharacterized protein (TIGR02118 family)